MNVFLKRAPSFFIGLVLLTIIDFGEGIFADPPSLDAPSLVSDSVSGQVQTYINQITTLKATFRQHNADGTSLEGLFFLSRPGKMRLKYRAPSHQVIISDGHFLIFHNPELDETTHIPLESTPAELLVKEQVNLKQDARIIQTEVSEEKVMIRLTRQDDPQSGVLTLIFKRHPFELREWIIEDQNQGITHVTLENLKKDLPLPEALFKNPSLG